MRHSLAYGCDLLPLTPTLVLKDGPTDTGLRNGTTLSPQQCSMWHVSKGDLLSRGCSLPNRCAGRGYCPLAGVAPCPADPAAALLPSFLLLEFWQEQRVSGGGYQLAPHGLLPNIYFLAARSYEPSVRPPPPYTLKP